MEATTPGTEVQYLAASPADTHLPALFRDVATVKIVSLLDISKIRCTDDEATNTEPVGIFLVDVSE